MRLLSILLASLSCLAYSLAATNTVLCYFMSWTRWREDRSRFTVDQIPPNGCTHIVYSFIQPEAGGQIAPFNDGPYLAELVALKARNPRLKILAALGGWDAGSAVFSNIVRDAGQRARFVQSIADFIAQHRLDGIDLDWEFPGERDGDPGVDAGNFALFLRDLRNRLGWNVVISAAVGSDPNLIGRSYDVAALNAQLTFINLMTYDYHMSSGAGVTGQNSPLYASSVDTNRLLNADAAVRLWNQAGAQHDKILLGLAFYGRNFRLADPNRNGVGAATTGAGQAGPYTKEPGTVTYLEICEWLKEGGWTTVYDQQQRSVYSYKGDQWVGYDNVQSIMAKSQYAVDKGLAGVMMWPINDDDAYNSCGGGPMPLLGAINRVIRH